MLFLSFVVFCAWLTLFSYELYKDKKRRKSYLARAKGIKNKKGELTWKNKNTKNYWSVHYLWAG